MSPKNISERIALLSIVDAYGEEGATLPQIQADWLRRKDAKALDQKQFIRCREDIRKLFGVEIKCNRTKFDSRYYVSRGGAESFLRMSALNAFLLQNIIGGEGFPKDRVYIDESYADDKVRTVSLAISQGRNIKVRQKRLLTEYVKVEGITIPHRVDKGIEEFEFTPYAVAYISRWFMFGRKTGCEELLVYSLGNTDSIAMGFNLGDAPKDFDLDAILEDFSKFFPTDNGPSFPDDRLQLLGSRRTTSFRLF